MFAITVLSAFLIAFGSSPSLAVVEDSWSEEAQVTFSPLDSEIPFVYADGSTLHIVWHDDSPGNAEVYHKSSGDGGATWSAAHRISTTDGISAKPRIVATSQALVVAWEEGDPAEIYFSRSLDGGTTWSAQERVTWSPGNSWRPRLAVTGAEVHLIWRDESPGNWEIYYKSSADHGATWGPGQRITVSAGESYLGDLTSVGTTLHFVWQDATPGPVGNWEVFHKTKPAGGAWSAAHRVTWSDADSRRPRITSDGTALYVLWRDLAPGNYEIYTRRSVDGGVTWTDVRRLTWSAEDSHPGALLWAGSTLYATWYDFTPGNWEIYTKTSDDGGLTWTPGERVTNTGGASQFPQLAADATHVHLVWQERVTSTNFEIFHAIRGL